MSAESPPSDKPLAEMPPPPLKPLLVRSTQLMVVSTQMPFTSRRGDHVMLAVSIPAVAIRSARSSVMRPWSAMPGLTDLRQRWMYAGFVRPSTVSPVLPSKNRMSTLATRGSSAPISRMPSTTSMPYHSTGIRLLSYHSLSSRRAPTTSTEFITLPNCGLNTPWMWLTGSSSAPRMTMPRITGLACRRKVRATPSRVSTVIGSTSL
mmetsp:Transcript_5280/g.13463  ORF Transcript_5280/g.13463 Transcript_5280/m.13463 type:complete len:206 (-) Transcript_5280:395-1012(-)